MFIWARVPLVVAWDGLLSRRDLQPRAKARDGFHHAAGARRHIMQEDSGYGVEVIYL